MSDFDKEAEREKLREKYGQQEENRKATEQMSELLLKGATMTNAHCTDCGDPVFRYDGQEFCPTCQKPVARGQPAEDGPADTDGDHIEVADPSDEATVQFGDGATGSEQNAPADGPEDGAPETSAADPSNVAAAQEADHASNAADEHPPAADTAAGDATQGVSSADPGLSDSDPSPSADQTTSTPTGDRHSAQTTTADHPPTSTQPRDSADGSMTAQLSAAESSLAATVHRFAQRAADTDDPRRAREHLKAAREAAEALDAVRL
jgi:uncharacterized Zn finger protein (UPF0148 family)